MILGGIPVRGRLDRGDDRGRPVRLVARDGRARGILLRGVQRADGAAILGADVVPLPVELRRIVGREHDVEQVVISDDGRVLGDADRLRSEEHTSALQSLMRLSYAVFCLQKKTTSHTKHY